MENDVTPRMSDDECRLFKSILTCSRRYLEFGCGGSTCVAASVIKESIISVDTSLEWIDKVRQTCESEASPIQPALVHIDIGPTSDWGQPSDPSTRERWPDYHRAIWARSGSSDADLYMIDGRFRVACFMQILLHSRADALIMIHDFNFRSGYHVVREVAREIAIADSLSLFVRRADRNETHVREILAAYEYDPG
jgi:hypothetical protein